MEFVQHLLLSGVYSPFPNLEFPNWDQRAFTSNSKVHRIRRADLAREFCFCRNLRENRQANWGFLAATRLEFVKQITLESPLFRPSIILELDKKKTCEHGTALQIRHTRLLSTYGTWTAEIVQNSLSSAHSFHQMRKTKVLDNLCCSNCHTASQCMHRQTRTIPGQLEMVKGM